MKTSEVRKSECDFRTFSNQLDFHKANGKKSTSFEDHLSSTSVELQIAKQ